MGDRYRVYYRRFEMHKPSIAAYWENLTKDFENEFEADKFINRIKNNIIVSRYVKSKIHNGSMNEV